MRSATFIQIAAGSALVLLTAAAAAQEPAPPRRAVDLPPSADLSYRIQAQQKGITLGGDALLSWRAGDGGYSINNVSRAQLLGKILENRSEGKVDAFGLSPVQFTEKRFRKDPTSATFDRSGRTLSFSAGAQAFPLQGGEQDRGSAQWQLASMARATPEKFVPGSEWKFVVAGRKDAEQWVFKVVRNEAVKTGVGTVQAVHLVKSPAGDARGQRIDLWLAPSLEWYPVKLRISEDAGEYVEQTLEKITRK